MKTVIIPSDCGDPFVVRVNNQTYKYEPGAEVSVPDEVAVIIDNYWKLQPLPRKPVDGGVFPYVSDEDNGKILKVKDGAWQVGEDNGGGKDAVSVTFTVSPGGSGTWTATSDKTYAEIIASINSGKTVRFCVAVPTMGVQFYTYTYAITTSGVVVAVIGVLSNQVLCASVLVNANDTIDANAHTLQTA